MHVFSVFRFLFFLLTSLFYSLSSPESQRFLDASQLHLDMLDHP